MPDNDTLSTLSERAVLDSVAPPKDEGKVDIQSPAPKEEEVKTPEPDEVESGIDEDFPDRPDEVDEVPDEEPEETTEISKDALYQQIKAANPEILKKFPDLRRVIHYEREVSTLFPTLGDAKKASGDLAIFHRLEQQISSGDSSGIIQALEDTGQKQLEGFVGDILPRIQEKNKDLYFKLVAPALKQAFRFAHSSSDTDISNAALHLHRLIFGDLDLKADVGIKKAEKDPREVSLDEERTKFQQERINVFISDITNDVKKTAKFYIENSLKDSGIDKYTLKNIVNDIESQVEEALSKDQRHNNNVKAIFNKAVQGGFTGDGKSSVKNAILARVKAAIPPIRQKVLSEAGVSPQKKTDDTQTTKPIRVPVGTSGSSIKPGSLKVDPKKIDWNKTSERELLEGKATMRK